MPSARKKVVKEKNAVTTTKARVTRSSRNASDVIDFTNVVAMPGGTAGRKVGPESVVAGSAVAEVNQVAAVANVNQVAASVSGETKKRKRPTNDEGKRKTYAPPEKYAHLSGVPDAIDYNLVLLLIGLNPGITTAQIGHAYPPHPRDSLQSANDAYCRYSNKTNRFWRYLHSGGLTPDRMLPSIEDQTLPATYSLGTTNLVSRPTNDQGELSKKEMDDSVPEVEDKIRKFRPVAVCIVGKGIWESIYRARHGEKVPKNFKYGWQAEEERLGKVEGGEDGEDWAGARVFVAPSTSGLVTIPQPVMQEHWKQLGDWVNERRRERGIVVPGGV